MAEQIVSVYTTGEADVAIAAVGLTIGRDVDAGFWRTSSTGGYKRRDYASEEALQAALKPLHIVAGVEGYLSEQGIRTHLEYMAKRAEYVYQGYNAWKAGEYQDLVNKCGQAFADREARKLFKAGHGEWATPADIRAGNIDIRIQRVKDGSFVSKAELQRMAKKQAAGAVRG